jgi:Coenzyme PQQ synthesis protein D (PqqD)
MTFGYRLNASHVVGDVFDDGEAAVIDLRTGTYFSLNTTGALLWPMIVAGTTSEALLARVLTATDGGPEVAADIGRFVAALVAEGLVEEVDDIVDQSAPSSRGPRTSYRAPELERFDDLQELLLLDPIHDVSDRGWPHTPPA